MEDGKTQVCIYCLKEEASWTQIVHFVCSGCKGRVHYGCIKSVQPSPLLDDSFFNFKCVTCSETGKEVFTRKSLSWKDALRLTLYHLQKTEQGKCGFFHWQGHICTFIESHWHCLFGHERKKTSLWKGTVAGALSIGCGDIFMSGAKIVEQGFWKLIDLIPQQPHEPVKKAVPRKKAQVLENEMQNLESLPERKRRRAADSSLAAAIELKQKRSTLLEAKEIKRKRAGQTTKQNRMTSPATVVSKIGSVQKANSKSSQHATLSAATDESEDFTDNFGSLHESVEWETTASGRSTASVSPAFQIPWEVEEGSSQASSDVSTTNTSSFHSGVAQKCADEETEEEVSQQGEFWNAIKVEVDETEEDLDIEIGSMAFTMDELPDLRPSSPDLNFMLSEVPGKQHSDKSPVFVQAQTMPVKREVCSDTESEGQSEEESMAEDEAGSSHIDNDEDDDDDDGDAEEEEDEVGEGKGDKSEDVTGRSGGDLGDGTEAFVSIKKRKPGRPRKRFREDNKPAPPSSPNLQRISYFEEREVLQKLNDLASKQSLRPQLAQLRRKLICNQTNREFGLPVFDLDKEMLKHAELENASKIPNSQCPLYFPKLSSKVALGKETRDLDRFMMHESQRTSDSRTYTSFRQRLVGLQDHELKPVISPYTTRVLVPFIWRNHHPSRKPLKMRLLEEIQAYPYRNDPTWRPPPSPPIDYCYVRPEHIASVNALCREFFWPGIDMSECLQYPDFSCVVLYRKIVVAFAFMVPDRGYNEAYISFILTHPEWRNAGIATFMVYHLIQTCMGKDVLLHVSVSNPAMLLYQKFGFKAQELSLNFYHKYFPYDSKESTHAFLMRLTR